MIFNGFNPYSPNKSTLPLPANEIPLAVLKGARAVNATHLSPDGRVAYDQRDSGVWYCEWDSKLRGFGAWWRLEGELPGEAVKLPDS